MLDLHEFSRAAKTKGCATTYRGSKGNPYGTCPNSCPLKPEHWQGSDTFDSEYMEALSTAVPKGGWSWTYSHFKPRLWKHLLGKNKTVINASATTKKLAVKYFKAGIPTVIDVLPDEKKNFIFQEVNFVTCPAVLSDKITCNNCGGLKGPLCARLNRAYIIMFPWHGAKASVKKMITDQKGICYGAGFHVNLNWNRLAKKAQSISDGKKLKAWVKTLPIYTRLRHHVVGDGGGE